MKEGWMKNDEGWMLKDECWWMNDDGWMKSYEERMRDEWSMKKDAAFKLLRGFADGQID